MVGRRLTWRLTRWRPCAGDCVTAPKLRRLCDGETAAILKPPGYAAGPVWTVVRPAGGLV